MEKPFSVLLTDLDGVIFWRIPAQKAGIPLLGNVTPQTYINQALRALQEKKDFGGSDTKPTMLDNWQAIRHLVVPVFPDVIRVLNELDSNIWVYGNTGRHKSPPMTAATWLSLQMAGIHHRFNGIIFRERNSGTTSNKEGGLQRTIKGFADEDEIVVVDDNPLDLIPMAYNHPNVRFILIRDLTTDRLLKSLDMKTGFKNVTIARTLREGLLS